MRHAGEVDDHRLAADRLAEADAELGVGLGEFLAFEQFAQPDRVAALVGQFDADDVAPSTTATRAETALIERAISAESAMTRDDLVPGAGSSS